jgi:hypothetical protein
MIRIVCESTITNIGKGPAHGASEHQNWPGRLDHADYDAENDVLSLHVGEPQEAEGEETPEGHVLRFEPGTQRIVSLTVLGAQAILDRDGELRITIPESVKASADDLAPALAAI